MGINQLRLCRRNPASLSLIVRSVPNVTAISPASSPTPWRHLVAPVLVTIALVVWTTEVSPNSVYGNAWAIVPALLALPVALVGEGVDVAASFVGDACSTSSLDSRRARGLARACVALIGEARLPC